MKVFLPNASLAVIPETKLFDYLLSTTHPIGKSKALFFKKLGYTPKNYRLLVTQFEHAARKHPIKEKIIFEFGEKFILVGKIKSIQNKEYLVKTVWVIEMGSKYPRFVTSFPV